MSGTILSYSFIANHWASESALLSHPEAVRDIGTRLAPRFVYAIGAFSLTISVLYRLFGPIDGLKLNKRITSLSAAMLCSWSPTILILLGRQGSFVALICITGGTSQLYAQLESFLPFIFSSGSIVSENSLFSAWCIIKLQQKYQKDLKLDIIRSCVANPVSVTQWSLLAVCLFYLTGHW
jgi:phosphatidylinositol glycan class O